MQAWWASLDIYMQILWIITLTASLIFVIQTILTFIGMDSDGGLDVPDGGMSADTDAGAFPFQLFTFRNFINFFLGFGWTAITLAGNAHPVLVIIVSILVGVALVAAVMYIFYLMSKMEQSGNIETSSAVGCRGSVYLTIPGERQGEGKVQINIQGAVREFDAMTNGDTLPNGCPIEVTQVLNENMLLVTRRVASAPAIALYKH